ncbi:uncharacterized protein IL334_001128 [Kwoniella shivajii]|uniref:DNA mismatch repair protein MutL n=1 Tax=Kwoniella shivajii TaxID=564305 RepID=A0ABZ1CS54_9TREE|nr:hypothetical protein IL334_001128 [Kwoniella shivajii]
MSGSIKAIDTDSVHRIHSGQVVLDLQGAIKELVENSLDAGATVIDVRIKDNGLDSIEVSDNGSGISESDWESIGLKHHTSKLPSLTDLYKVTTFGFRGEALSALCALCENVTVITATKETTPMGAIIKLGKDGRVVDHSGRIARPRGTTVTLTGLFTPLPVRRKEFERTVKRELTKALTLLTAYALVPASVSLPDGRIGVRLRVETIAPGKTGKRNIQLSTDGRGSLNASVGAVWGSKSLEGVQDIDLELEVEIDRVMARREGISEVTQKIKVAGLISSAQWGQGRSSADRQFYFINGRPCNLTSVARAINEVYKTFNTHQVPLAILDFQIPPQSVDINVSPDKRTIFVHSEDRLIETLKIALDEFYQPSRSTFAVGGATQTVKTIRQTQSQLTQFGKPSDQIEQGDDEDDLQTEEDGERLDEDTDKEVDELDNDMEIDFALGDQEAIPQPIRRRRSSPIIQIETESEGEIEISQPSSRQSRSSQVPSQISSQRRAAPSPPPSARRAIQRTLDTTAASWSPDKKSRATRPTARAGPGPSTREARLGLRKKLEGYASQSTKVVAEVESEEDPEDEEVVIIGEDEELAEALELDEMEIEDDRDEDEDGTQRTDGTGNEPTKDDQPGIDDVEEPSFEAESAVEIAAKRGRPPEEPLFADEGDTTPMEGEILTDTEDIPILAGPSASRRKSSNYRDEIIATLPQGEMTLLFNINRLKLRYSAKLLCHRSEIERPKDAFTAVKQAGLSDAAGISNKDSVLAEEALSRVISKKDFEKMKVLGQFNKGFIIARLTNHQSKHNKNSATDDLFIIDQHASDEKYNFETLQRTTIIKGQALIKPRALQLTAGDEIVAIENLDILSKNGFDVKVDEDKPPGRGEKISLISMPVSKETTFDFKDLEQLLHMLSEGSSSRNQGQMVRCTKARSMFAMRACRKSVMIGKSLTKNQMINLLRNMGTIDQPWNCPHGRPTMRHLTKIEQPSKARSGHDRIDWKRWKERQGI